MILLHTAAVLCESLVADKGVSDIMSKEYQSFITLLHESSKHLDHAEENLLVLNGLFDQIESSHRQPREWASSDSQSKGNDRVDAFSRPSIYTERVMRF